MFGAVVHLSALFLLGFQVNWVSPEDGLKSQELNNRADGIILQRLSAARQHDLQFQKHNVDDPGILQALRTTVAEDGMLTLGEMQIPIELYQEYISERNPRYAFENENYLWPVTRNSSDERFSKAYIPYIITEEAKPYEAVIKDAMMAWEQATCIKFQPFDNSSQLNESESYVLFNTGPRCGSGFGRKNPQEVHVGDECANKSAMLKLLGYVLAIIDEVNHPDRDDYIIDTDYSDLTTVKDIILDKLYRTIAHNVSYDYTSVMHPKPWRLKGAGGISLLTMDIKYQGLLGRYEYLSHRDNLLVNTHYSCLDIWQETCNVSTSPCINEGYLGEECECICRSGTAGDYCQNVTNEDYYGDKLPSCSRDIEEETTIRSPEYPSLVPFDTWCVFKIIAPLNCTVKLLFSNFHLEESSKKGKNRCINAFMEIRCNSDIPGDVWCGSDLKPDQEVISETNEMYIYFDVRNNNSKGFEAEVIFEGKNADSANNPPNANASSATTTPTVLPATTSPVPDVANSNDQQWTNVKKTSSCSAHFYLSWNISLLVIIVKIFWI